MSQPRVFFHIFIASVATITGFTFPNSKTIISLFLGSGISPQSTIPSKVLIVICAMGFITSVTATYCYWLTTIRYIYCKLSEKLNVFCILREINFIVFLIALFVVVGCVIHTSYFEHVTFPILIPLIPACFGVCVGNRASMRKFSHSYDNNK